MLYLFSENAIICQAKSFMFYDVQQPIQLLLVKIWTCYQEVIALRDSK